MPTASRAQVASALVAVLALLVAAAALWLSYRADQRLDLRRDARHSGQSVFGRGPPIRVRKTSRVGKSGAVGCDEFRHIASRGPVG